LAKTKVTRREAESAGGATTNTGYSHNLKAQTQTQTQHKKTTTPYLV